MIYLVSELKRKLRKRAAVPQIKVMKTLNKKLGEARKKLEKDGGEDEIELLGKIIHWLEIDAKSHWSRTDTKSESYKEEVAKIKERGSEILRDYNIGPGMNNP